MRVEIEFFLMKVYPRALLWLPRIDTKAAIFQPLHPTTNPPLMINNQGEKKEGTKFYQRPTNPTRPSHMINSQGGEKIEAGDTTEPNSKCHVSLLNLSFPVFIALMHIVMVMVMVVVTVSLSFNHQG